MSDGPFEQWWAKWDGRGDIARAAFSAGYECGVADQAATIAELRAEIEDDNTAVRTVAKECRDMDADEIRNLKATVEQLTEGLRLCPAIASMWSMKPSRSLHPDIPWEKMNESSQTAAHSAAQQIAIELEVHVNETLNKPVPQ
jgi:hypothetical protein